MAVTNCVQILCTSGDFDYEAEELDDATRQFNFWTHQLHIFFVRKFFPIAHKYLFLRQLVRDHHQQQAAALEAKEATAGTEGSQTARSRTYTSSRRGERSVGGETDRETVKSTATEGLQQEVSVA